jgi:uroporphyrinogen decarboxylase
MRQAGRYQAWYRKMRERVSFIELCRDPELCTEVTVRAAEELDVDAAIMFSDILLILEGLGAPFRFTEDGPELDEPMNDPSRIARLKPADPHATVPYVFETIGKLKKELAGKIPLICFSGARFTLAAYLVEDREGVRKRGFEKTRAFFFQEPDTALKLMEVLARTVTAYLNAQIEAGVQAVQIFDTHAGVLAPQDYTRFVQKFMSNVISNLKRTGTDGEKVPVLLSAVGAGHLLESFAGLGADVIAVDWRTNIDDAWARIGYEHAVMGNLDPAALLGPRDEMRARVIDVLSRAGKRKGHVFNLGHGILPQTDPDNAKYLVDCVHELSAGHAIEPAKGASQ